MTFRYLLLDINHFLPPCCLRIRTLFIYFIDVKKRYYSGVTSSFFLLFSSLARFADTVFQECKALVELLHEVRVAGIVVLAL